MFSLPSEEPFEEVLSLQNFAEGAFAHPKGSDVPGTQKTSVTLTKSYYSEHQFPYNLSSSNSKYTAAW